MPINVVAVESLGKQVGPIVNSGYLALVHLALRHDFLHPQIICVQVPNLSQPAPLEDTQGCARIREKVSSRCQTQIAPQTYETLQLGGALDDSI